MQKIIYVRYNGETLPSYRKGAIYKLWIKYLDSRSLFQKILGKEKTYHICIWKANRKNDNVDPDMSYYVYPSEGEFWRNWSRDKVNGFLKGSV